MCISLQIVQAQTENRNYIQRKCFSFSKTHVYCKVQDLPSHFLKRRFHQTALWTSLWHLHVTWHTMNDPKVLASYDQPDQILGCVNCMSFCVVLFLWLGPSCLVWSPCWMSPTPSLQQTWMPPLCFANGGTVKARIRSMQRLSGKYTTSGVTVTTNLGLVRTSVWRVQFIFIYLFIYWYSMGTKAQNINLLDVYSECL